VFLAAHAHTSGNTDFGKVLLLVIGIALVAWAFWYWFDGGSKK
jgi:hypothetical protein